MERPCAIVPAYNEAPGVLQGTLEALMPFVWRVAVVDDGSRVPVQAALPAAFLKANAGRLALLRHGLNCGQGAALQTGMDYAKEIGADCVIHFDADGQHDPREIPAFLAALDAGADVAVGSRFLKAEDIAAVPRRRRLLLRLARIVNGLLTGLWLTDVHNGFRALNRHAFTTLHLSGNRMSHASEILWLIKHNSLKIKEIPTHIHYSAYSTSKGQRARNAINILVDYIADRVI